jgi:hypothetical protein
MSVKGLHPAQDPDLAHLLDLLAMLPGPTEDREFWAAVQNHGRGHPEPVTQNLNYVYEKMAHIWLMLQEPAPSRVSYLARYMLYFFSGDDPDLWKVLNRVTSHFFSLDDDSTDRWWAADVCRTAWALYVRYGPASADDQWKDRWRFQRDWTEWLPEREQE